MGIRDFLRVCGPFTVNCHNPLGSQVMTMTTTTKIAGESMTDEQIYEALAPIADEEIMARNKASIIAAGRALLASKRTVPDGYELGLAPTFGIPLHEDMRRALEHVECVYRLNFVPDGEQSSTLDNLQRVIKRIHTEGNVTPAQSCESCEGEGIIDCYACPDCADQIQEIANKTTSTHGTSWWTFNKKELVAFAEAVKAKPTAPAKSCGDAEQADEAVDAARYRWLRHADLDALAAENWGAGGEVYEGERFDAAVDAARAKDSK